MENALHGDHLAMLDVALLVIVLAVVASLAVRGAWAIWQSRAKADGAPRPTTTADTLAALLEEGGDDPGSTIEEKLDALALGIKNLRHRQSMFDGRLNKIDPPAEKGKGQGNGGLPPNEVRPLSRSDIYKRWREKNAGKQ